MRRVLTGLQVAIFMLLAPVVVYASNLDIAKQALRDNLWEIARTRSETSDSVEAKIIILESYAREGKWSEIINALNSWVVPSDDIFHFYGTLAKAKLAGNIKLNDVLSKYIFSDSAYAKSLAAFAVQMALKEGDAGLAKRIVEAYSLSAGNDDAKAISAEAFSAVGDNKAAESLWREVVASTNASDRAFVLSAWSLGDVACLNNAYMRVEESADLRRLVGLRLGVELLKSPESFADGKRLIIALVNDSPGTLGAREAFINLASKCLDRGEYEEASKYFLRAIEAWPVATSNFAVYEGYGWSLFKSGKFNEAILSFSRAEECATNDIDRASAVLMQGDILAKLGRGDESMSKYRIVLSKYPKTPAGEKLKKIVELKDLESRGRELYREFRFSEASDVFAEVTKRDSASKPRMDYLRMLCLYGQGKDDEASAQAKDLAQNCPDATIKAEATLWLAKFFFNAKQWTESCELFEAYATNMMSSSVQAPSALLWASRAAFAAGEFRKALEIVTKLAKNYPSSSEKSSAYVLQGEALMELSRFDEAVVIFQRALTDLKLSSSDRVRAKVLWGDSLFVIGADNPVRYKEALECYRALYLGENLDSAQKINIAFKMARTMEKLDMTDAALDQYYGEVICAYRDARKRGEVFSEEVKANFARAAFKLADEYERRGQDEKAKNILRLLIKSDVKSSEQEATRKLRRIKQKGSF